MSGVNVDGIQLRKGAADAIARWVRESGGSCRPAPTRPWSRSPGRAGRRWSSRSGRTAATRVLGVVHLKDVVKGGMKERFDRLRAMGIRTVMITGDNPLTAAAIAARPGWTTSSPRRRRKKSSSSSGRSRPGAASSR